MRVLLFKYLLIVISNSFFNDPLYINFFLFKSIKDMTNREQLNKKKTKRIRND
jgi:hypothetical protein